MFNRNFSSLETKVSGIALQPEESTTQPEFPTNVELHFNIDRTTLSTVYIKIGIPTKDITIPIGIIIGDNKFLPI